VHYIDWHNPANNLYHVTDELAVEKRGSHRTRREWLNLCEVG
jgi:hypothetical protein